MWVREKRNLRGRQFSDAERLVYRLDQEIRSRGHGSIRAVDRAAGHRAGWWQHRADSGDIRVHQLLTVLDHLGLDPAGFIRRALGSEGSLELDKPHGRLPEIVTEARRRTQSASTKRGVLDIAFLESLEEQRHHDAEEVPRLALWAVDRIDLTLLPRLLGISGSAFWSLLQLDEAEHSIHTGIEIAQASNDRAALADLLNRLSYVISARGDWHEALRIAEKAAVTGLRVGIRDEVGRSLVAQGIWLYYLNRALESIEAMKAALDYLSPDSRRNRFAVFQVSGLAHQVLGENRTALNNVDAAQHMLPPDNEWARGKLLWLKGKITADLGQWDEAALILEEVGQIFSKLHYGEAALATCELVRLRLIQGRYETAHETATRMRALLEPLRSNKVISAAISDLLRHGQAGLTLALIQRVMAQIKGEQEKGHTWRSMRLDPSMPPLPVNPPGS
jgi:tetratricopeptide (TPR) repeat protein